MLMMTSLLGFDQFKSKNTFTWSIGFMLDDEAFIQVRRMREQDLESQVDLLKSEHEYEDYLDIINLPLPIPMKTNLDYKVLERESHHH